MKSIKSIFILCISLMLLWQSLLWAQQQTGLQAQTQPAGQNQSAALDNNAQMTDIHDIKPPEKIGFNPAFLWYAVIGTVLLVILIAVFIYWNKRRKREIPQVMATVSPEESALNSLGGLQELMYSNGKQFYFQLSMILREYLRQRFAVGAPEMTTEELLPQIAEIELPRDLDLGLRNFVRASDPVKFAGRIPEIETMQLHLDFVRLFVQKTTPLLTNDVKEESLKPGTHNP